MKKNFSIFAAVFAIIGCSLPWVQTAEGSVNGFHVPYSGFLVFFAALVCASFSYIAKKWAFISSITINALILLLFGMFFIQVNKAGAINQIGIGIYLVVVSEIAMIIGNILSMKNVNKGA
ncbi:MAG: hypothetical protein WCH34_14615 [Bacteroidota bacterium]